MSSFGSLFGWTPYNDASGLVSPEDARIAQQQGQLGIGAGLLSAAGPSPYPTSVGQGLSAALLQGRGLQNSALDSVLKRQLVASEAAQNIATVQHLTAPRPNIQAILGPLVQSGAINAQQAQQLGAMAQIDPQGFSSAMGNIMKPAAPVQGELAKKIADAKAAGVNLTPDQIIRMAGGASPEGKVDKSDEPLSPADLERLRDKNGGKLALGTTGRQAAAAGAQTVSQDELDKQQAAAGASQTLDMLERLALDPQRGVLVGNPASVPGKALAGMSHGIGNFVGTQASQDRDEYKKLRLAYISLLARANGEKGNLSDTDIARIGMSIPDIGTPEPQARAMFNESRLQHPKAGQSAQANAASAGGIPDFSKMSDAQLRAMLNGG
jgi:hypothetical protein